MKKIRVSVIGAGSWALAAHLPALKSRDDVELVGVCRSNLDAAERIRDTFGFEFASADYRDVLTPGVDAVIVASPSSLHHEHAAAALRSGAHVLCEKPMTIASAEAWDLVEIAREHDRELLIAFGWNFMAMIRNAKEMIARVGIGTLEHVTVHMSSSTRELLSGTGSYPDSAPDSVPQTATWTDPLVSGGGYGQAQLSHALGLTLALFPDRIVAASAQMFGAATTPVELHDAAVLNFESGAIGVLSGASAHAGAWKDKHDLQVRAVGSEGQAMVDVLREEAWIYRPDSGEHRLDLSPGDGAYQAEGPANALIEIALGRGDNPAPGTLGALTAEALELVYRSAAQGGSVAR
ncbi:Gfo/Idh/MocA family protein [Rhodoglobus sp.]